MTKPLVLSAVLLLSAWGMFFLMFYSLDVARPFIATNGLYSGLLLLGNFYYFSRWDMQ